MGDSRGYRGKFAVVAPSTNTSVRPEHDSMRPRGVTNAMRRRLEVQTGTPAIAINTATCWHALRTQGIMDQFDGFGTLLADY